jgi:hypothetical protein
VVQADYTGGTAHWCGAAQKGSTSGRAALELLTGAGYGKVPAFSILIHIHDMADRKIYRHAGGVEILQKIGAFRRIQVQAERLLKGGIRNRRAVETAPAPLMRPYREAARFSSSPRGILSRERDVVPALMLWEKGGLRPASAPSPAPAYPWMSLLRRIKGQYSGLQASHL